MRIIRVMITGATRCWIKKTFFTRNVCKLFLFNILFAIQGCSSSEGPLGDLLKSLTAPSPGQVAREAFNLHDADIRRRSVTLLASSDFGGEPPYLRLYRLLVDDPDATVRAACIKAIGMHCTTEDIKLITDHLEDDSMLVRWEAAKALQKVHDPLTVGPLIRVLNTDDDADVRMAGAYALGQYPQLRVYQTLVGSLDDSSFSVVQAGRHSLRVLTGYDFGNDASLWLLWAKKQGNKLFDQQQVYTWQPYEKPAGALDKILFWKQHNPIGPQAPKPIGQETDHPTDAAPHS